MKLADSLDPAVEDSAAITAFLEQTVLKMVEKARRLRASDRAPKLPLVRLRVRCAFWAFTLTLIVSMSLEVISTPFRPLPTGESMAPAPMHCSSRSPHRALGCQRLRAPVICLMTIPSKPAIHCEHR